MKLNKKIIAPALTLLAGASLAGSVTGTIAWYQYSTRANVSYIGTSAGVIGNLQIRLPNGEWGPQIQTDDVLDYLTDEGIYGEHVEPVTPGALAKNDSLKQGKWQEVAGVPSGNDIPTTDIGAQYFVKSDTHELYEYDDTNGWQASSVAAVAVAPDVNGVSSGDKYFNSAEDKLYEKVLEAKTFYLNPTFGNGPYSKWYKASEKNYVRIPLQLRFIGQDENDIQAKDIYLSKLQIQKDTNRDPLAGSHGDISDAIRVHISAYQTGDEDNAVNHLISKNGGTTLTHGKLNLGRGSDFDKTYDEGDDWGFDGSSYHYVEYGAGSQNSYAAAADQQQGRYYEEEAPASGWKENALSTGDVAPDNANGEDGDFYLDTAENKLYKKAAGAWAVFADYLSGAADPDLDTENTNNFDYYLKTGENKLFLRALPTEETVEPVLAGLGSDANNPLKLDKLTADKVIGQTDANADYLNVDVTIWVEGWQKFNIDGSLSSIWKKNLIGAMFDVGLQFAVQDLRA